MLVLTPEPGEYNEPAYSPDGTRLAFTRRNGGDDALWVADLDGGNAVQVSPTANDVDAPNWSPDGRMLAYHAVLGAAPEGARDRYGRNGGAALDRFRRFVRCQGPSAGSAERAER